MATPQSVRYINLRRALDTLFRHGGCSRAELSRHLGMTRSATSAVIASLLETGLVAEEASKRSKKPQRTGRPGIDVSINPDGACFVGAEIGVDHLSVVVTNLAAQQVLSRVIPFDTSSVSAETTVDVLVPLIHEVLIDSKAEGPLRGVCVCLPAFLRLDGTVINGLYLKWREVPLLQLLTERLGSNVPIAIENDANAFAIAETYGRPKERDENHAFFLLEAGVGGGVVIGGELYRGSGGLAGELGQTLVGGRGFDPESAAKSGHVESYIRRDALLAHWRQLGGPADGDLATFLTLLAGDDKIALQAAQDWGRFLAAGMVQVTAMFNPDSIILGGSVSRVFEKVAPLVRDAIRSELLEGYPVPQITVSKLGVDGPAMGAAHLMHQRLFRIDTGAFHGTQPPQ